MSITTGNVRHLRETVPDWKAGWDLLRTPRTVGTHVLVR